MEEKKNTSGKWRFLLNRHVLFLVLVVALIAFVYFRFAGWGSVIDLDEYFQTHDLEIQEDTLDVILPLTDADGKYVQLPKNPTLVFFGNTVLCEDKNSKTGIANMIQKQTGGTVYNLAIENSYCAVIEEGVINAVHPMDAACPYNLALAANYPETMQALRNLSNENSVDKKYASDLKEVLNTMDTINWDDVDVICFFYDSTDYYMGRPAYDDSYEAEVHTFNGNITAAIEVIQAFHPDIRIIVMSPAYAYGVEDDGSYVSSDIKSYGTDGTVLSTYVNRMGFIASSHTVSFVDNLYGTITQDNAKDYLVNEKSLNQKGRQLMAKRFLYALYYYDKD